MRSGLFGPSPIANVIKKEKLNTEKVFFLKSHKLRICDSEIRFRLRRRKNEEPQGQKCYKRLNVSMWHF